MIRKGGIRAFSCSQSRRPQNSARAQRKNERRNAKAPSAKEKNATLRIFLSLKRTTLEARLLQCPKPLDSHVLTVQQWSSLLAILAVLFWPSCPSFCPVPAALSRLSRSGSAVLAVLSQLSCLSGPGPAALSQLSCPSCTALTVLSYQSCPDSPVLTVLSVCPVLLALF